MGKDRNWDPTTVLALPTQVCMQRWGDLLQQNPGSPACWVCWSTLQMRVRKRKCICLQLWWEQKERHSKLPPTPTSPIAALLLRWHKSQEAPPVSTWLSCTEAISWQIAPLRHPGRICNRGILMLRGFCWQASLLGSGLFFFPLIKGHTSKKKTKKVLLPHVPPPPSLFILLSLIFPFVSAMCEWSF